MEWVLGTPTTFNPFTEFVETLYKQRSEFRGLSDERAGLVKLLLNSLYGRWGLNPSGGLYRLIQLDTPDQVNLSEGGQALVTPFGLYGYEPLPNLRQPEYVNVLFAAQIAAAARLHLLEELEYQNEYLGYCDTDSIITRGRLNCDSSLGGWREEAAGVTADLVSPKDYSLTPSGGEPTYTTKGVPQEVSAEYFQEGMARFRRALGVREALQHGRQPSEWVQTYKSRGVHLPKRMPLDPALTLTGTWSSTAPYSTAQLAEVTQGRFLPTDWEEFAQVPLLPLAPQLAQLDLW